MCSSDLRPSGSLYLLLHPSALLTRQTGQGHLAQVGEEGLHWGAQAPVQLLGGEERQKTQLLMALGFQHIPNVTFVSCRHSHLS